MASGDSLLSPSLAASEVYDALVFVFSVLLFCLLALVVTRVYPPSPDVSYLFAEWNRPLLRPEGAERLLYISGLLYFLVVPAAMAWFLPKRFPKSLERIKVTCENRPLRCVAVFSVFLFVWALAASMRTVLKYKLYGPLLISALFFFVVRRYFPLAERLAKEASGKARFLLIAVSFLSVIAFSYILGLNDLVLLAKPAVSDTFRVLLGTINQVSHGRTILVDLPSQYGTLYPYLAVLFSGIFGNSIPTVSAFFVLLTFLSFFFLMLAVYRKTGVSLFSLLLFAGVIGLSHPFVYASILGIDPYVMAPYYAYLPIRVLFGAFMLYYSKVYLDAPSVWAYLSGTLIAAVSILWNTDTGLVIAVSWQALLLYQTANARLHWTQAFLRTLKHAMVMAAAVVIVAALYAAYAKYRSGSFPDWALAARYQAIFYKAGFMMLRMKPLDIWHIPLAIYAVSLFGSVLRLLRGRAAAMDNWYFYIAVYGLGIFSYYQGRSHLFCLTAVAYPAALIAAFYAFDLVKSEGDNFQLKKFRLAALSVPLLLSFVFGLKTLAMSKDPFGAIGSAGLSRELDEQIHFVRSVKDSGGVAIWGDSAEYVYSLADATSPLPLASMAEVILVEDIERTQSWLDSGITKYVLVGKGYEPIIKSISLRKFRPAGKIGSFLLYERIGPGKGGAGNAV